MRVCHGVEPQRKPNGSPSSSRAWSTQTPSGIDEVSALSATVSVLDFVQQSVARQDSQVREGGGPAPRRRLITYPSPQAQDR